MARLMSVALTEQAVRERRKTVTRRLGWSAAYPGMDLTLVRKSMGRSRRLPDGTRHTEPLVIVGHVRVLTVRREPLNAITDLDVDREGFGPYGDPYPHQDWWPAGTVPPADVHGHAAVAFVRFFTHAMRCAPDTLVNRIEWEYVEPDLALPVGCRSCGGDGNVDCPCRPGA